MQSYDMIQTYLALVAMVGLACAVAFAIALVFVALDRRDAQARGPGALAAWRREGWATVATMFGTLGCLLAFGVGAY